MDGYTPSPIDFRTDSERRTSDLIIEIAHSRIPRDLATMAVDPSNVGHSMSDEYVETLAQTIARELPSFLKVCQKITR